MFQWKTTRYESFLVFFGLKNTGNFTAKNVLFGCYFILELVNTDINLLLCGDINLPLQKHKRIFAPVHKFIDESCRFS